MSLRQIKRNIRKQEDAYLEAHKGELRTHWRLLPEDQRSILVNMSRNGITPADLDRARLEARNEAYRETAPAVVAVTYAAMGIMLHDEFGFSNDDVVRALRCVDRKLVETIDNADIEKELEEKCEIRIRSKEGVGRIEKVR